jgi:hypothetical protein
MVQWLYQGTSERHLPKILRDGLRPRGQTRVSNWGHTVPSHMDTVYLTDSYGIHFAACATRGKERMAVLKIDASGLDPTRLVPDEDALEQMGRGRDGVPGDIGRRTVHYRENAELWPFDISLRALGTCGYRGTVEPERIKAAALLTGRAHAALVLAGIDPVICLANYSLIGQRYRNSMRWLFGDPLEPEHIAPVRWEMMPREGIEIRKLNTI